MTDRKKISGKIQLAILVFFIVFMPLGSWYYLQSGFNYHKKLLSDLKDYGKVPALALLTQNGDSLRSSDLHGKITVATFFAEEHTSTAVSIDYAKSILQQFKSQDDLYFLFHSLNPAMQNDSLLEAFAVKSGILDKRVFFLSGDEEQMIRILDSGYKIPASTEKNENGLFDFQPNVNKLPESYPYFVLIDTSLTIRNYYDINNKSSIDRLVEHLAIILPREKKSKAERIPQKEK